ncbi:MAG: hypothetical protein Q8J84_08885 [Flavobacteriaceae bacterium]|nr:hypothetical protein [Flavobacteriaceae bacterium]
MVLLHCNSNEIQASFDIWKFIQDLGPTIVSLLAILATFFVTRQTLKSQSAQNIKALNAQKDLEARQIIQKKLDEFYGPLIQQRMKSTKLYEKFSKKYREKDDSFSTLLYLINNRVFVGNDKVLLEQIIKLGEDSERLIQEKSGLIDDSELRLEIIPRATTHFLLIKLAYNRELTGNSAEFKDLTYPKEFVEKLEARKSQLETELLNLNKRES